MSGCSTVMPASLGLDRSVLRLQSVLVELLESEWWLQFVSDVCIRVVRFFHPRMSIAQHGQFRSALTHLLGLGLKEDAAVYVEALRSLLHPFAVSNATSSLLCYLLQVFLDVILMPEEDLASESGRQGASFCSLKTGPSEASRNEEGTAQLPSVLRLCSQASVCSSHFVDMTSCEAPANATTCSSRSCHATGRQGSSPLLQGSVASSTGMAAGAASTGTAAAEESNVPKDQTFMLGDGSTPIRVPCPVRFQHKDSLLPPECSVPLDSCGAPGSAVRESECHSAQPVEPVESVDMTGESWSARYSSSCESIGHQHGNREEPIASRSSAPLHCFPSEEGLVAHILHCHYGLDSARIAAMHPKVRVAILRSLLPENLDYNRGLCHNSPQPSFTSTVPSSSASLPDSGAYCCAYYFMHSSASQTLRQSEASCCVSLETLISQEGKLVPGVVAVVESKPNSVEQAENTLFTFLFKEEHLFRWLRSTPLPISPSTRNIIRPSNVYKLS